MSGSKKPSATSQNNQEIARLQFVLDGKRYDVLKGATVPLPSGTVKLTAADICVHEEAQKYLVEAGASCIIPVIE